jgi:hypothetical protein
MGQYTSGFVPDLERPIERLRSVAVQDMLCEDAHECAPILEVIGRGLRTATPGHGRSDILSQCIGHEAHGEDGNHPIAVEGAIQRIVEDRPVVLRLAILILGVNSCPLEPSRLVDGLFAIVHFISLNQDTIDQNLEIEDIRPAVAIEIDA